jgi:hypothetical protein
MKSATTASTALIVFLAPGGHRSSAAEASFLTLSHAPGKGFWLALYRRLPGFAVISELVYAFIAAHRPAFYRVSVLLWGRNPEPPRYDLVSFLFLRLFGLIYLSAFIFLRGAGTGLSLDANRERKGEHGRNSSIISRRLTKDRRGGGELRQAPGIAAPTGVLCEHKRLRR